MKGLYLAATMMILVGSGVFARGATESGGTDRFGEAGRPGSYRMAGTEGDAVSISGTILDSSGKVVLETAEGLYSLSARGFRRNPVEIPYGESVTVTGTAKACSDEDCLNDDCDIDAVGHIFVDSAESGAESYAFGTDYGPTGTPDGISGGRGRRQPRNEQDFRSNSGRGFGRWEQNDIGSAE